MITPQQVLAFLMAPVPFWFILILGGVILLLALALVLLHIRLADHARSIGNMDAWADSVDEKLTWLEKQQNAETMTSMHVRRLIRSL